MIINHVINSIDMVTGGPARSVTHLIQSLTELKDIQKLYLDTIKTNNPIIKNFDNDKSTIKFHHRNNFNPFNFNVNSLNKEKIDIYHGHGLWQMPIHLMSKVARKRNIPYIITPRGMLEPWSMRQKYLKKKIAFLLYQKYDLMKADCIHVTASSEAESVRKLGFKNPIAVVPNGIYIPKFSGNKTKSKFKKALFLSRIHPKKGIEILIKAWSRLNVQLKKNWTLEIVGDGNQEYILFLKKKISEFGLSNNIKILDPIYGKEKLQLYINADLFILPTHSENFGIVVAEALACKTPVITTKGAPWNDLIKYNCGKWIDLSIDNLVAAMNYMMSKDSEELLKMGNNGRNLIINKYSISSTANKILEVYKWTLKKGDMPNFIYI